MPDPAQHLKLEGTDNASIIKMIEAAGQRFRPPQFLLEIVGENPDIAPGQLWSTRGRPSFPPDLPEGCSSDDPFWVIVADAQGPELDGHAVLTVFPVLIETEMCGPQDVFLPRRVLGFEAIATVGSSFGILRESLDACKGRLATEWRERLSHFWRYTQGLEREPGEVQVGHEYLSERDLRFRFHEELVPKLDYLQQPLLVWAEQCGVIGADEPVGALETLRAVLAEKWRSVREWCEKAGLSPSWSPSPEPVLLHTGIRRKLAVIEVERSGRPKVLTQAEERNPLPSAAASWRLDPALPDLAGRRFVVAVPQGEEILGHGEVQEGGARLTLSAVFTSEAPENAVLILI